MPIDVLFRTAGLAALAALAGSAACGSGDHARQLPDAPMIPDAAADGASDASGDAGCRAGPTDTRIQIAFDSQNAEWVKSLTWRDSSGVTTANLAASGTARSCSGPNELFGQLFGVPEGNPPYLIGGDTLATSTACGDDVTITTAAKTCDVPPTTQIPITTVYHYYGDTQASEIRITRTIGFDATTPVYPGVGIRPYVPRVPLARFSTVVFPAGTGTTTHTAFPGGVRCGADCLIDAGPDWNGRWIADVDPQTGLAIILLRDPSMTSPVQFTVNNDADSASNLSSFVLDQPSGGWKAPITEIEYLCFADLLSWPQEMRDGATLPVGCSP